MIHFENLWEQAENLQLEEIKDSSSEDIINELIIKFKLYSNLNKLNESEQKEAKKIIFESILLLITQLSSKDNLNVFLILKKALEEKFK